MRRVIGTDDAINEISEILIKSSGEWLAIIYKYVSGKRAIYENGKIIVEPFPSEKDQGV